jgi:DNA-binding response OmpR family regulator
MAFQFDSAYLSPMSKASPHVLIVDDDPAIRDLLRDCLEPEGFRISEAADSAGMNAALSTGGADLVTLDLMLGGENGLVLAAGLRARHAIPIVMITGKGDMVDRVVGLEMGADDYIAKPFHPREVVARIRAVLRRAQPAAPAGPPQGSAIAFNGFRLDPGRREVFDPADEPVALTTAEFNLLELFTRHPQRVLSRDMIMDLLKGHEWTPFDRSIDALVSRLRRKVEADPDNPVLIKTVRGVGYLFTPKGETG